MTGLISLFSLMKKHPKNNTDQFCPNGFFKNSDSISIVYQGFWIQNGGKLNFRPILSKWISNISKTLKALVYEGFLIQNGGNSISDQFCPNGYFKNFGSISIHQNNWFYRASMRIFT